MSDNSIPFDIQIDIIQRLPIKSFIRFQCVSKQWKSHISSTKFINDHRINHKQSQHRLLVRHKLNPKDPKYTSIIINDTSPNQKSSVSLPPLLRLMNDNRLTLLNSVNGLLCFYGFLTKFNKCMIVLWNPTIRKTVGIPIPTKRKQAVFGFGFCRDSIDPKLIKIIDGDGCYNGVSRWKVDVFTLSSRVWKTVFTGRPPIGNCILMQNPVCIDGIIYWFATYSNNVDGIVSFDLKSEEFGKVCLPDLHILTRVAEMNWSLAVFEYHYDRADDVLVYGVWMMESVTKSFAKMFNVKVPVGHSVNGVFWLRKNSKVIIEVEEYEKRKSRLEVLDPSSGRINDIGINEICGKQRGVSLYMETLLLLDEPSLIISLPPKKKTSFSIP